MDLDISYLWKAIWQRWIALIIWTIVTVSITGVISFFSITPEYEATAKLLVQSKSTEKQVISSDLLANRGLVTTYGEIMTSNQIAEDVISRLHLTLTAEELLKKIRIRSNEESLIFTVTARDPDYHAAVMVVNAFAQSFYDNLDSIMNVDNVSILDAAKEDVNPTPVLPKPFLNMAVVFVLTFTLFVGYIIFLELTNNTIRTEEEAEEVLGIPVLGTIGVFDHKGQRQYRHEKVSEGGVSVET